MPSLKDYRTRIASVKSTRKITSAMKMVAASKLKRAQEAAEASQPYAKAMAGMIARVAQAVQGSGAPKLLIGTGSSQRHLVIVMSSDRGLCGGFNGGVVRFARNEIRRLEAEGKNVQVICVGRKARDLLKRDYESSIVHAVAELGGKTLEFYRCTKSIRCGDGYVCTR